MKSYKGNFDNNKENIIIKEKDLKGKYEILLKMLVRQINTCPWINYM